MKRCLTAIAAVLCCIFLSTAFCACSWFFENRAPVDVYLPYLDGADAAASGAQYVAAAQQADVVTVIATYPVRTDIATSYTQVYSGVIINKEGYVLTTSAAASLEYKSGAYASATRIVAVLSDVYGNDEQYLLKLIDHDSALGVALFVFYDTFYTYTDPSQSNAEEGFCHYAALSAVPPEIGDACVAVGNATGAVNSDASGLIGVQYVQQAVTQGVVSAAGSADEEAESVSYGGTVYPYLYSSASVTPAMLGGALFDANGYLIGMLSDKVTDGSSDESYLRRFSASLPANFLSAYLDAVSEQTQTVIPYTLATAQAERSLTEVYDA